MADFQYLPDMDDPIAKLRMAMNDMDGAPSSPCSLQRLIYNLVDGLRSYTIPAEPSDIQMSSSTSHGREHAMPMNLDPELVQMSMDQLEVSPPYERSLRAFPPPLFSRQGIPQGYKCVTVFIDADLTSKTSMKFQGKSGICENHNYRRGDWRGTETDDQ
jgi:general transcription factor 3C polypeptide 5 (transcription factor C subunit 1)